MAMFAAIANVLALATEATTVIGASGIGLGGTTAVTTAAAVAPSTIQAGAAVAGLALTGAGVVNQVAGQRRVAEASKRAEQIRERQAALAAMRERRQIIRQAQAARAVALANAATAGAEDSSAVSGAFAQIGSEQARGINASFQNQDLGTQMFATQRDIATGKETVGIGSGLADLGKGAVAGAEQIGRIGSTLFSRA